MEYDVTTDRDLWIGGSDVACIMGISPFKTRWELLLEKAGLKEIEFVGNRYTQYGQLLEPCIRDYINDLLNTRYIPNRVIKDDLRCHSDGYNGESILEIKTTSHIYDNVNDYKHYLVQLLLYMDVNNVDEGVLAIYHRPADFDPVFDSRNLTIYNIKLSDYKQLLDEIHVELDRFRADLKRLKENPLLTEQDFMPNELVTLANQVPAFEARLQEFKEFEKQYNDMKQRLLESMQKYNVKSWETPSGIKITRVDGSETTTKTIKSFDEKSFAKENPALYEMYCKTVETKKAGRSAYIKVTLTKTGT